MCYEYEKEFIEVNLKEGLLMSWKTLTLAGCFSLLFVSSGQANSIPDSTVIDGDLRITGNGSGLVFPDSSIQTTATVQGPQGLTGPQGPPGPQGPAGPQGPSGNCSSLRWPMKHFTTVTFYPANGQTPASTGTMNVTVFYDSTGKQTGWYQKNDSSGSSGGFAPGGAVMAYHTDYDAHNNPTNGYMIIVSNNARLPITHSYTYDADGNKTQRVRTYYDPTGTTITQTQTTNYGAHGAYLSESRANGSGVSQGTLTYTNTFDANGYPVRATLTGDYPLPGTTGVTVYEYSPQCAP